MLVRPRLAVEIVAAHAGVKAGDLRPVAAVPYTHLDVFKRQCELFAGPDAYVTPSWYALKQETGKVVPTWNYVTVHASGPVEFFDDPARLLDVVTRLTNLHEGERAAPWAVADAPPEFIQAQLRLSLIHI